MNVLSAFLSRSYGITGLADVVGAIGQGKSTQVFVGRQSFADGAARPMGSSAKDCRPTREFPQGRYENALAGCRGSYPTLTVFFRPKRSA